MRLENKVSVITGAGLGMGREASLLFAREGSTVVVFDIDQGAGRETVRLIEEAGGRALFVQGDVSDEAAVRGAVELAVSTFGGLHVLYANAGVLWKDRDKSVVDTTVEDWDRVQAINLRGPFLLTKHGIPALEKSGGGSIVLVGSISALAGFTLAQDSYTAAKSALIGLTKSLAVQFGPRGVRSNAICPGPIETPLLTEWLLKDAEAKRVRLARNPTGRFGRPEDIVNAGIYLASDESAWTNGAVLVIDGGITSNYF
jgi:NAD(P)-dependent dehydrogenase (short-subunit alcohol dehydrogenase family)